MPDFYGGGAERVFCTLANGLAHKYQVLLFVDFNRGPNAKTLSHSIKVVELAQKNNLKSTFSLIKKLRIHRPDFIISGIGLSNIKSFLALILLGQARKLILTYHCLFSRDIGWGSKLTYYFAFFLTRFSLKTICVSQDIKSELCKKYYSSAKKLTVISNPFDIKHIQDKSNQWQDLDEITAQTESPIVLAIGRLVPEKGYDVLIKAFARLKKQMPCQLIFLGQGELKDKLIRLTYELGVDEDVQFLGYVDNPFVYLKKAAVHAISSHCEGFGNTIVESLIVGTPVVSTNCPGGPKEILDRGKYGALTKTGSIEELSDAIRNAILKPPEKEFLLARGREFSVQNIVERYEHLIVE
ncbi:MAG: glycosyltransferase [Pseudomonadota bacterium]